MGVGEWANILLVYRTISLSSAQLHASTETLLIEGLIYSNK